MNASIPVTIHDDCCTQLPPASFDSGRFEMLALACKALGDRTRLHLLALIAAHPNGEACICELTDPVGLSQPTVSHHMKLLVEAGLVVREQRGRWAYFRIVPDRLQTIGGALDEAFGRTAQVSAQRSGCC